MNKLELKTYPDPCLRIKTNPVESIDQEIVGTLRLMSDLMYLHNGIGLAATQVGVGLSLVVVDLGDELINFINPEIVDTSKEKDKMEEGCLSLPDITVDVSRPISVKVRARDASGNYFVRIFKDLSAKAVQHEIDHLRGVLIIDYLNPLRRFMASRKLRSKKCTEVKKNM